MGCRRVPSYKTWETPSDIIAQIDHLIDEHTDKQIASILNEQGLQSGKGKPFSSSIILNIRKNHELKCRFDRLRERGMLTMNEMAARAGVSGATVRRWLKHGLLQGHAHNDHGEYLLNRPLATGLADGQGASSRKEKNLAGLCTFKPKRCSMKRSPSTGAARKNLKICIPCSGLKLYPATVRCALFLILWPSRPSGRLFVQSSGKSSAVRISKKWPFMMDITC